MNGNDIISPPFRAQPRDVLTAIALLTRLPLPARAFASDDPRPAAYAAWAYPLVGLVVGALSVGAAWLSLSLGLPAPVAALFAVLISAITTGAMHEDGLADCADGFWGGWTQERRLEIMKDSQVGTYGVIALMFSFGIRWLVITALLETGSIWAALLGAAVLSRAAMVVLMYALPHARSSGLSHHTGKPPGVSVIAAVSIGLTAVVFVLPAPIFGAVTAVCAVSIAVAAIAKAKISGQTGDVLGASQQMTEITVLLTCLAAML